tara:strand:+ start:212 stop:421 length:210 start_codon:yes stop_codon:yes gene_type:complete
MGEARGFGILCIVIVIFLEIGRIISNLYSGLPAFFLFDFSGRFYPSTNEYHYLIYWCALIGIFLNIFKD